MRERRFKQLIEKYPNLVDGRFMISHAQALRIIDECGGYPSLEETIRRAKTRSDLPDSAWEAVDKALLENKRNNSEKAKVHLATFKVRHGFAVALAVIIILVSFFTVTPSGRALAKQFYGFIIEFFDTGYTVTPSTGIDTQPKNSQSIPFERQEFSSYNELEKELGQAVYKLDFTNSMVQDSLILENSNAGLMYFGVFSDSLGRHITIIQEFDIESTKFGFTGSSSQEWTGVLSDGTQVHCYISDQDGSLCAVGKWNNSLLTIIADKGIDYTRFIFES